VAEARSQTPESEGIVIHRPTGDEIRVDRADNGSWIVAGRAARRAVALNDLTDPQAVEYIQSRLRGLGLDKALLRAGARTGDEVHIGGFVFEYEEDA
jgi:GTP-binding protein